MSTIPKHIKYHNYFIMNLMLQKEILNARGERLTIADGEIFQQCYSPNDNARRDLPPYWFVSDKTGNVIRVYKHKLVWLKRNKTPKNREYYRFTHAGTKERKTIMIYDLVGVVWGSERFGKAKKLFEEKGINAIGIMNNKNAYQRVNGHHKESFKDNPDKRNDPNNLEFVSEDIHKLIENIPSQDSSIEKKERFAEKTKELAKIEAPGEIVIIAYGYKNCIKSFKNPEDVENDPDVYFAAGDVKKHYEDKEKKSSDNIESSEEHILLQEGASHPCCVDYDERR